MDEFIDHYLWVFFPLLLLNVFSRLFLWGKIFGHNVLEMMYPTGNIDLFEYNQIALFPTKINKDIIDGDLESSGKKYNFLVIFYYWVIWGSFLSVLLIYGTKKYWYVNPAV